MTEIPANERVNEAQSCPRCGAGLSAQEAVQGLCAGCLLVAALDSRAEGESAPRKPSPSIESLAPHFPDLELLELVGQGGMGAVYRVRQKKLARFAALKILALDGDATPAFAERFEREARTLASLGHENIVAIYDQGRAGPHWYLLMEYVDGVSLRQMIRAREVDPRTALGIVAQICDALQCAHDRGVVHRDVKPENVLVDRRGRVKILDFGLAKLLGQEPRTGTLTETGQIMGTPRYMAPEQWERPLSVDHRADIYAVGVVFYELLTGELPIGAFQLPSHFASSLGAIDARVDPVVMKTLAKEPDRRYQHASEVSTDVQRIASGPASIARASAPAGTGSRWGLWLAVAAVGCVVVVVAGLALTLFVGVRSQALDESAHVAAVTSDRVAKAARAGEQTIPLVRDPATGEFVAAPQAEREKSGPVDLLPEGSTPLSASDPARNAELRFAREKRLDELAGPPLDVQLTASASPEKRQRAHAKLDALWRAYLSLEMARTRVMSSAPDLVVIEVGSLDAHELAQLAAFADALYEPTELELAPDLGERYRVTTSVASVDRLSPIGASLRPRVSFAESALSTPTGKNSLTTLSEFLESPDLLPGGWFPALDATLKLEIHPGEPSFATVMTHTNGSRGATLMERVSRAELERQGYARFFDLPAVSAWADGARGSGAEPSTAIDFSLPAPHPLSAEELRAAERDDDENGGPSLDHATAMALGWTEQQYRDRLAIVDAIWRVALYLEGTETSAPQRDQVIVHARPYPPDDTRLFDTVLGSLCAPESVNVEGGWQRRYRVATPWVVVTRSGKDPYRVGAVVGLRATPEQVRAALRSETWSGDASRLYRELQHAPELTEVVERFQHPRGAEYTFVFAGDGSVRGSVVEREVARALTVGELNSWRHRRFVEQAREVWNEKQKR